MRNTYFASIEIEELAAVTGGCKKKAAPQAAPCNCGGPGGSIDVEVATGAQAQAAMGGSQAPQLI